MEIRTIASLAAFSALTLGALSAFSSPSAYAESPPAPDQKPIILCLVGQDCDKDADPTPKPHIDVIGELCLDLAGCDEEKPKIDDLKIPEGCVQIHKEFPCPGDDDEEKPELGEPPCLLLGGCEPPEEPEDEPEDTPQDDPADQPQDDSADDPGDDSSDQPLEEETPADEPEPTPESTPDTEGVPEVIVTPAPPSAGTGTAFGVPSTSGTTLVIALALVGVGAGVAGFAIAGGKKS